MGCIAVLGLVSPSAKLAVETLLWVFAGAPIFGIAQVEMSTAKSFGGDGFVEGCLKSQINVSIGESNVGTIGAIGEASKVVVPQLTTLANYSFLLYKLVVFTHESAVSICALLELDYFFQYSVVTEFL